MTTRFGLRTKITAIAALLVHGVLSEIAQLGIPERSWDPFDLLVNLVSVLVASAIWSLIHARSVSEDHPSYSGRGRE